MHLKQRMLGAIIGLIVLGFLATSLLSFYGSRQNSIDTLVRSELPLTSDNIYSEVQRDLLGPQIVSSVMSNDTFVKEWIAKGEQNEQAMAGYLAEIADKYDAFTAFLAVNKTRNYYTPKGFFKQLSVDDPVDDWFFERSKNQKQLLELNIDPAEAYNDELTIFFNVLLFDEQDRFSAVTGLGLKMDLLSKQLENYKKKYGNDVYFLTPDGVVILHTDRTKQFINISDLPGLQTVSENVLLAELGHFSYQDSQNEYFINTRYIEEIDLILVVEANLSEVTQELYTSFLWNLVICAVITLLVVALLLKTLKNYQGQLEVMAWWDQLTGLFNRQAFDLRYEEQTLVHRKLIKPMSLMLIDIDYFKDVNDKRGHLVGDKVLKEIGYLLQLIAPEEAILARWGGEEFVVLLKNTPGEQAYQIAESIRKKIEMDKTLSEIAQQTITASIGVVSCDLNKTLDDNLHKADQRMYRAKDDGRNRVVFD